MLRQVLLLLVLAFTSGCASIHSQVMPENDFFSYKTAYVEPLHRDEFNLATATAHQLSEMGFRIVADKAPENPTPTDMLVRISYLDGWDLGKYLKSYQLHFLDARSKGMVASTSFHMEGNWVTTEARLQMGFNRLKEKLGIKETKESPPSQPTNTRPQGASPPGF